MSARQRPDLAWPARIAWGWGCFRNEGGVRPSLVQQLGLHAPGFGLPLQGDISAGDGELVGSRIAVPACFSASPVLPIHPVW